MYLKRFGLMTQVSVTEKHFNHSRDRNKGVLYQAELARDNRYRYRSDHF